MLRSKAQFLPGGRNGALQWLSVVGLPELKWNAASKKRGVIAEATTPRGILSFCPLSNAG
jgi:hypothetical protein